MTEIIEEQRAEVRPGQMWTNIRAVAPRRRAGCHRAQMASTGYLAIPRGTRGPGSGMRASENFWWHLYSGLCFWRTPLPDQR